MTAAEWFGIVFGGIVAMGVFGGGVVWSLRLLWYAATLVSEVQGMRSDLQQQSGQIDAHGNRIGSLEWWAKRQDDTFEPGR